MDMNPSTRKVALVTGASRGIGRAIARELASRNYRLALSGRDKSSLEIIRRDLPGDILVIPADLLDSKTPEWLIGQTVDRFGQLDLLVNNAGVAVLKPFGENTPEDWDRLMTVNAKAPYFLCREALPHLRKSDDPVIINISSVMGHKSYTGQSIYAASKHAMMGWTKTLAKEMHKEHIRVHAISPGGVDTQLVGLTRPDLDSSVLIRPGEIARIVGFLIDLKGNAVIDEIRVRRQKSEPWK